MNCVMSVRGFDVCVVFQSRAIFIDNHVGFVLVVKLVTDKHYMRVGCHSRFLFRVHIYAAHGRLELVFTDKFPNEVFKFHDIFD